MRAPTPRPGRRCGIATVEFAVVAPLLLTLLVGIWEVGRLVEVKQILDNAAREGARQASTGNKLVADVQQAVLAYLTQAGLPTAGVTVTVTDLTSPSVTDPTAAAQMDNLQVTVSLPFDNVRWVLLGQLTNVRTLSGSANWFSMRNSPVSVSTAIPAG